MPMHARENLSAFDGRQRLVAVGNRRTDGLHVRTVRGILNGTKKPHAQTLHRLAEGIGVSIDEFFVDPAQLVYRRFDRRSNPLVAEAVEAIGSFSAAGRKPISTNCTAASAAGGALTAEGV